MSGDVVAGGFRSVVWAAREGDEVKVVTGRMDGQTCVLCALSLVGLVAGRGDLTAAQVEALGAAVAVLRAVGGVEVVS